MTAYLFVAKPETEHSHVRAGTRSDWSCSAKAKPGDTAFIYITGGTGITAEWAIESSARKEGQYYRCDVRFIREIIPPVTIRELKVLAPDWAPVHQNLRGHHATRIPSEDYDRICLIRPTSLETELFELEIKIQNSRTLSKSERAKRLKTASSKPERIQTIHSAFRRNHDVIAEVLERASGKCERCNKPAPFIKKLSGEPYLEVHHIIRLADGGDDTVENATALCPNCHRYEHYA